MPGSSLAPADSGAASGSRPRGVPCLEQGWAAAPFGSVVRGSLVGLDAGRKLHSRQLAEELGDRCSESALLVCAQDSRQRHQHHVHVPGESHVVLGSLWDPLGLIPRKLD